MAGKVPAGCPGKVGDQELIYPPPAKVLDFFHLDGDAARGFPDHAGDRFVLGVKWPQELGIPD